MSTAGPISRVPLPLLRPWSRPFWIRRVSRRTVSDLSALLAAEVSVEAMVRRACSCLRRISSLR
ncbi:MAG: hypothetical protein ACOCYV_00465 [Planctomycetota bacterium]